ncbi:MAG: phosphate ABC transporter substrate-binding/OmpA family protein [Saprospiraceae bacterium]
MTSKLTPFAKILIVAAVVGGAFLGVRYFLSNTETGKKMAEKSQTTVNEEKKGNTASDDPDVIKIQVFTFGGYAAGWYYNEGFEPNENSRFFKEYGLKVKFVLIDDFDASRQAFKSDEVQLFGNETSAMVAEMEGLGSYNPNVCFQVDWSRGADALVVKRGINSANDLRGKKIAVTPATPSQTFLLWMLDAANMSMKDIQIVEVPTAIDAATAFKSGQVDAALVWSPDDEDCVRKVPGAKILQSTRQATNIIADVMMSKREWAEKNRDKLAKLYAGWMKGAAELNCNEDNMRKAAKIMAENTGISEADALAGIKTLRLTNHGDNVNFFGKNNNYKGVTGEDIYTKMGSQYEKLGMAKEKRPNWRELTSVNVIGTANLTGTCDIAEAGKVFSPVTEQVKSLPAVASKPISITFPSGQYLIDENAKTLIDLQFKDIAKAFASARIRIEGNTDNVGKRDMNLSLSQKRAESVAKYLETEYGMSRNRFIVIGNGPDKPITGCEQNQDAACKAKNRRTEFKLVAEQ